MPTYTYEECYVAVFTVEADSKEQADEIAAASDHRDEAEYIETICVAIDD